MKKAPFSIIKTVLLHTLFWFGVWFFFYYFFSYNSTDIAYVKWFSSLLLPLTMAVTYFSIYFLIPKYLLEKKYFKFGLFSFYTLLASSYFIVLMIYGCLIFLKKWDASSIPPMIKNFVFILILVYMIAGLVSFVSILNHNFRMVQKNKELQNKILTSQLQIKEQELQYLKMQIHPHFLFNTLNTIYGFALKQSKQTPDIILKLSNLLDYILYQINKPRVSLKEEVTHIQEYIELERIRFQESLKVKFSSDPIDAHIQIAPMLLIPFVENAFKHGSQTNDYLRIEVEIKLTENRMLFSIGNTVNFKDLKQNEKGIGLENINRRLDLYYANNYRVDRKIQDGWYRVELEIFNLMNIIHE